jgi:hypothetical protein
MKHIVPGLAALLVASSAAACSSLKHPSAEELFAKATSVFRARVTEARLATFANPMKSAERVEVVEARYEITEVFKGNPSPSGVVRDLPFGPGNCSLGLLPGTEYVFFPGENDFVLIYSGSFAFFNAEGSEVKPQFEALRKLGAQARR